MHYKRNKLLKLETSVCSVQSTGENENPSKNWNSLDPLE